jgi:hypothetical protein
LTEKTGAHDENDITAGALDYISRGVPEHATAIRELFSKHSVHVRLTPDFEFRPGQPIDCSPGAAFSTILWPPQMYTLMWLLAHGAWEVMRDYGSVILAAYYGEAPTITRTEIDKAARELGADEKGLLAIYCARRTALGEEVCLPPWLPNITDAKNIEHAAVRELWLLAIVWMLLHELQHIAIKDDELLCDGCIDEELSCDKAAAGWLFSDIERYANDSQQPADKIRGKRAMGTLVGLFCIGWLSDYDRSETHPAIGQRLAILLDSMGESDASWFWAFAAGLIYVLSGNGEVITFPRPGSIRDLVVLLADSLDSDCQ